MVDGIRISQGDHRGICAPGIKHGPLLIRNIVRRLCTDAGPAKKLCRVCGVRLEPGHTLYSEITLMIREKENVLKDSPCKTRD